MRTQWVWNQIATVMLGCAGSIGLSSPCIAQVVPDQTLPVGERSQVSGDSNIQIDGGATRGSNLFHSFREFSIPTGGSASFNNAPQIENILTRVTGNSVSNIDGLLRSNGSANLFLLNPNGIIFGANARLDVGGAFVTSTADAIGFPSGDVFSATNPTASAPLLNVNPNALLFNQLNPQPIVNRSIADTTGLTATPGQTLALVGGDVRLETGRLTALGGRVELGGLSAPGAIGLRMNGNRPRLEFPANVARSDVSLEGNFKDLRDDPQINVAAGGGGSIAITTRNLNLNRSFINAGIGDGLGTVNSQAGDIEINATGAIALVGSAIVNTVGGASTGQGGSIRIRTGSLSLTNLALLTTRTSGQGDAGDILIEARDTVSFDDLANVSSTVDVIGIGRGGNIRIRTGSLSLTDSAQLNARTSGQGDAGDILIEARDTVFFDGVAFTTVEAGGVGRGGNIRIRTGSLSLTNLAVLTTTTLGQGDAGDILIEARDTVSFDRSYAFTAVDAGGVGRGGNIRIRTGSLSLTNGAQLFASTVERGDAGDILIEARGTVSFDGTTPNGEFPSGALSTVEPRAIGAGGDITVIAADLAITDGAELNASSSGRGRAGDIRVNVPQVRLDQGDITAETRSGDGGNIDLTVPNTLLLRRGSSVSTTAGTAQAGGDGGNIRFNGSFIFTVPSENNDITANAFTGRGGSVDITAEGIIGFASGRSTLQSDITASSEFGTQGTIALNTPDVDPTQGLTALPTDVVDASDQIAIGCSPTATAQANRGEFYQTGRGGIAPSPIDPIASTDILEDLQPPASWSASTEPLAPMVEAQGWQVNDRGEVMLVAATLPTHCER